MKNSSRILSALFFILLLAMPLQVFADEKGGKHSHGEEKTETNEEANKEINKEESHDESDDHGHGESDDHAEEADDHGHGEGDDHGDDEGHEGDDHGDDGHGDDGHGKSYEEVGPNYPVLGTFAAINGGFLLFGAIRKISSNRRKRGVQ